MDIKPKTLIYFLLLSFFSACTSISSQSKTAMYKRQGSLCQKRSDFILLIHGGAGSTNEAERSLRSPVIQKLLKKGYEMLKSGATSLDVVQMAVQEMEDSGAFNAGKGSISNKEGFVELDAAMMNGVNLKAASVAGVTNIKNPILAARKIMDESENVMFVGKGAENFAAKHSLKPIPQNYFINFKKSKKNKNAEKDHGTVGAVAMDTCGNLASATSTGGWEEKIPGRVGDSPIIGAGTYASNDSCAVSATGHGEYFIRWTVAHDIAARVKYLGHNAKRAADEVIEELRINGGEGGVIVIDKNGKSAFSFNSEQMTRGYINSRGEMGIAYDQNFLDLN